MLELSHSQTNPTYIDTFPIVKIIKGQLKLFMNIYCTMTYLLFSSLSHILFRETTMPTESWEGKYLCILMHIYSKD